MARLPREMKRRHVAKLVLGALAERADDDGANAMPSVATIAAESEVSPRTVPAYLEALSRAGLIEEQAPPSQRYPRTWRIELSTLRALADEGDVADLDDSRARHLARQVGKFGGLSDRGRPPRSANSGSQVGNSDSQVGNLEPQVGNQVADEQEELVNKGTGVRAAAPHATPPVDKPRMAKVTPLNARERANAAIRRKR